MKQTSFNLIRYGILLLCVFSFDVFAQVQSDNVLDGVVIAYRDQAAMWVAVIENAASWLFWLLVSISMIRMPSSNLRMYLKQRYSDAETEVARLQESNIWLRV